jgi:hypothetical protein
MPAPTVQELNDAKTDLDDLEQLVNGDAATTVTTRIGGTKDSFSKAVSDAVAFRSVADYTELAAAASNDDIPVGAMVYVTSIPGPPFQKKTNLAAVDDGGMIITENRGTITVSQHYFERLYNGQIYLPWYQLPTGGDDTTLFSNAFSAISGYGGGTVLGGEGDTYTTTALPALTSNVRFNMNGSTVNATLGSGNVYGLRIGPENSGVENGTINVISTGSPSSQFIFHAPISCGNPNGLGGTVSSPSTYAEVKNFFIRNMVLSSTRTHGPVIQIQGNSYKGEIKNIYIPDSSTCSGVHLDWSDISVDGTITGANIPLAKETYLAGDGYTTHPHDITIENIECGDLTVTPSGDLGSRIVRLSGCYNITARNLYAGRVTQQAVINVGGDLGFEFAPEVVRSFAQKGIKFENVACERTDYQGAFFDTYGDNIQGAVDNVNYLTLSSVSGTFQVGETITGGTSSATATIDNVYNTNTDQLIISSISGTFQAGETITGGTSSSTATIAIGYSNIFETRMQGNIVFNGGSIRGTAVDGAVGDIIRIQDAKGIKVEGVTGTRGKNGVAIEAETEGVKVNRCYMYSNLEDGYNVLNSSTIENVEFSFNESSYNGGKAGTYGGYNITGGNRIKLRNNTAGATDETSENFGFWVHSAATRVTATGNTVLEISQDTDVPFNWGGDSKAYGVMWECHGNEYQGSLALNEVAGVDMITVKSTRVIGDFVLRELWGSDASLSASTTPTTGAWIAGDKIYFTNPAASGDIGTVCVTSGSPGTWKRFGQIDA